MMHPLGTVLSTLAPRVYEGVAERSEVGGSAYALRIRLGYLYSTISPHSPSQKSKIFASPLINAGAEAALPLGAMGHPTVFSYIIYSIYSLLRMILPLMVLGSSLRNSTILGYL